uniref:Putative capsid protein n=1 Tax=viral metagenome TaxID=1070528 RepID=A0A6M3IPE5_9ZZZZ
MASGYTTSTVLTDSLDDVRSSARITREQEGKMTQVVDRKFLGEGIGPNWNEVTYAQLTAMAVTESTDMDENFQQLSDSLLTIIPTMVGISTFITDRLVKMMNKTAYAKTGKLAMNAIVRKMDQDGITVLDGATTSLCGAGTTLTSGHISAAVARISGNTTEPGAPPYFAVLHGYQIKDIADEITAGVGTYALPEGITARVWSDGFEGRCGGAMVIKDGNITIDASADAKGGVFAQEGIVLVMNRNIDAKEKYLPNIGGGGNAVYVYVDYAYGERSAGNFLYEIYSDATAPTS